MKVFNKTMTMTNLQPEILLFLLAWLFDTLELGQV
jgi:hypothetical protein